MQCTRLAELLEQHRPTVLKIDAEGAERFLAEVCDFGRVRLLIVEWDWTHNRNQRDWERTRSHLVEKHGFDIKIKGRMPLFDEHGDADLTDSRGKKRGNTGMIFFAARAAPS